MTIYAVGDIQGCFSCLEKLLDKVSFTPRRDQLWAVGDLVNRGPASLQTLRFCKSLGDSFCTALGNHDLSLLAIAHGAKAPGRKDTLQEILTAPDRHSLLEWLQHQPVMISHGQYSLVHAGIPPQWTIEDAQGYASELETALRSPTTSNRFFKTMYGNEPRCWRDDLEGNDRLRAITNYFTRMRYCDEQGALELQNKLPPANGPVGYLPWYSHSHRKTRNNAIIFGHWASLNGSVDVDNVYPLDTGCVWGGRLRLMSLDTGHYSHQACGQ